MAELGAVAALAAAARVAGVAQWVAAGRAAAGRAHAARPAGLARPEQAPAGWVGRWVAWAPRPEAAQAAQTTGARQKVLPGVAAWADRGTPVRRAAPASVAPAWAAPSLAVLGRAVLGHAVREWHGLGQVAAAPLVPAPVTARWSAAPRAAPMRAVPRWRQAAARPWCPVASQIPCPPSGPAPPARGHAGGWPPAAARRPAYAPAATRARPGGHAAPGRWRRRWNAP